MCDLCVCNNENLTIDLASYNTFESLIVTALNPYSDFEGY